MTRGERFLWLSDLLISHVSALSSSDPVIRMNELGHSFSLRGFSFIRTEWRPLKTTPSPPHRSTPHSPHYDRFSRQLFKACLAVRLMSSSRDIVMLTRLTPCSACLTWRLEPWLTRSHCREKWNMNNKLSLSPILPVIPEQRTPQTSQRLRSYREILLQNFFVCENALMLKVTTLF